GEVLAGLPEHAGELERERERAVEILVQAVVAAGRVAEEKRRRPNLAGGGAAREPGVELGRIAVREPERLAPPIRDRREPPVDVPAERGDDAWQRLREVLVLAEPEAETRHVDPAPEAALLIEEPDELRALVALEERWRARAAALVEAPLERG